MAGKANDETIRERHAREQASQLGLSLEKDRTRSAGNPEHQGGYRLVNQSGVVLAGEGFSDTLGAAEDYMTSYKPSRLRKKA
jgi:hypothetical protein